MYLESEFQHEEIVKVLDVIWNLPILLRF
jgi:hypothetical protein